MSKIVVIGATGHIGTYLVPRLVMAGHGADVAVSRAGRSLPAQRRLEPRADGFLDRDAEEAAGEL